MSKKRLAAAGALMAALTVSGVAAASHRSQATQQAVADFSAGSVTRAHTRTCTASDGAYQETTATYSGTASSSDARLNGPLEIRASSVVNTTTGVGWVEGSFRIRGSDAAANGTIHAALAGGNAVGAVVGRGRHTTAKLVASFAAGFTPGGGFSSGKLGSGSANGAGVLFTRGTCTKQKNLTATAIFRLRLNPRQVVPKVSGLKASGTGNLTLDLTRDANGAVTGGTAVFYINYRFPGAVTIASVTLHQGARGANGGVVIDAGTGSISDPDGRGNVTKVVTGVSGAVAQALLADPRGYYVEVDTSANPAGALRDQLGGFTRR